SSFLDARHSNVFGMNMPGPGNMSIDPQFVATPGDLRLAPGSPLIEAGDSTLVAPIYALDLAGNPRIQGVSVDIGAYEQHAPCPGDLDGNGAVDVQDLLLMLAAWGNCPNPNNCPADL